MENRSQIQNDEMEINLVEVALVLARKIPLMIACMVLFLALSSDTPR